MEGIPREGESDKGAERDRPETEIFGMSRRWHTLSQGEKDYCYDLWCRGYTLQEIGAAIYASTPTVYAAINGRPRIKAKIAPYSEVKDQYEGIVETEANPSENG